MMDCSFIAWKPRKTITPFTKIPMKVKTVGTRASSKKGELGKRNVFDSESMAKANQVDIGKNRLDSE